MHLSGPRAPSRLASDLVATTRILRCDDDATHARALFHRYQRLFIGASVVRGILALRDRRRGDPEGAADAFSRRREAWETSGGYLETVTLDDLSSWVASDEHIVAEATDPDLADAGEFVPLAQSVFRLPLDDWVVPRLAEPQDDIFDRDLHDAVLGDGPHASALIDYLGVLPEWADKRLAGAARYAGMRELIRQNRSRRASRQIRWVLGLSFAVQGVEAPGEDGVVWLGDLGQREIANRASLRAISTSARCPARIVGKRKSAPPVPVACQGRTHLLHVDWYCYVRDIHDVAE